MLIAHLACLIVSTNYPANLHVGFLSPAHFSPNQLGAGWYVRTWAPPFGSVLSGLIKRWSVWKRERLLLILFKVLFSLLSRRRNRCRSSSQPSYSMRRSGFRTSAMRVHAPFLLKAVFFFYMLRAGAFPALADENSVQSVGLDMDVSRVYKRVDERFLSVAIDASLISQEKFMYLLGWVSVWAWTFTWCRF